MKVSEKETELGYRLDRSLTSEEFRPEDYKGNYRIQVLGMLVDIMEALKRRMERIPAKKKPALPGAAKKKKRLS